MVVGGLIVLAAGAGAQSDSATLRGPVVAGTRVRVWQRVASSVSVPIVGRVAQTTPDSIALHTEGVITPVALAWPAVERIEVSAGPLTGSRARGALIGGIIGAVGGAVFGAVLGNIANHNAARYAAVGFVGGGGIGAGVGAYIPGEQWQPATMPSRPSGP